MPGTGSFQESTVMTRPWEPGVSYNVGELIEYQGQSYKVIQGHSSQGPPLSTRNPVS